MIVLLTDFSQSEYVGVMKGVMCRINNNAKIIDLCHDISPQNIMEASWILKNNYKYFKEGVTFCCVVDPGVGTKRRALAIKTGSYYFVAPDNGLLWETLQEQTIIDIRNIPVPEDASRTFHGRDVFAKAAANVDLGNYDTLGSKTERIEKLQLYQNGKEGLVVRIDSFGNVITNLPNKGKTAYMVTTGENKYRMNFYPDYQSAKNNELFLIEGSCNTLEISLKNDNANNELHLEAGTGIEIS